PLRHTTDPRAPSSPLFPYTTLFRSDLDRRHGAGGNAAADRHPPQHRDQQNPRARGHKRGVEEAGRGDDVDAARRIRCLCAIRDRQMGQTHQSQRPKARMNAGIHREGGVVEVTKPISPAAVIRGEEHWTEKGSDVRLFLWNKHAGDPSGPAGRILFVHGSSMASQPTFDLQVPGRADSSVMDFFARRGYDTWCVDMEG